MMRSAVFAWISLTFAGGLFAGGHAADAAGDYRGTYTSDGGGSDGKIHTVLKKNSDNTWSCQFSFTDANGEEVGTKVISCSADNNKLHAEYSANVDGTDVRVSLDGAQADDNSMSGTYKAYGTDGGVVDSGKWKAALGQ